MKIQTFVFSAGMAVTAALQAADYSVTNETKLVLTTGDRLIPAALQQGSDTLPGVATPIFHLDAMSRTGWEFSDSDAAKIKKIPSRSGERWLTSEKTGGSWTKADWPVSPLLIESDPTLGGRPSVDFGEVASKKGLLFNPVADETTGNVSSNTLNGIGTVFWVVNSENGGGSLFGGGYGLNNGGLNNGNMWLRGLSPALGGNWDFADPWSPLIRYYDGAVDDVGNRLAAKGIAYHDARATVPMRTGMNGGWEVISLQPLETGLTATGLGLGNVGRNGTGASSGGQRIAELIVYGEILSDADRARVEAYLKKKWFGEDLRGWNDNAVIDFVRASKNVQETYLSNGAEVDVELPEGKSLKLGRLMGGRGGYASFNVDGDGTLEIGDATAYQGTMRLHGGCLSFDKRPIPSALPAGAVAHFDASVTASYTTETGDDGLEHVTRWNSLSDFTYKGHGLCLAPNPGYESRTPWLCPGAMPSGRPAVDFGNSYVSGPHLILCTTNAVGTVVKLDSVSTVIAVMSPHSGAVSMVGAFDNADPAAANARSYFNPSAYNRGWTSSIFSATPLSSYIHPTLSGAADNVAYIDGIRHDHTTGYPHPGWQVAAFTGPGSQFAAVGATAHHYYAGGAMRLAEMVVYTRPLSEQELKDASAYLSAKWFNRETPGYARTENRSRIDDIPVLDIAGESEIHVAEGNTVRVGRLSCNNRLRKTGAGTLEIAKSSNAAANLTVEEGDVVVAPPMEIAGEDRPAAEPSAHFDASDLSTLMFNPAAGLDKEYVWTWYDKNARNSAYWVSSTQSANQPWLNRTDTLNSLPVLDFGANGSYRYLHFARPLDGVKAAFVVWGSQEGGGCLLGNIDVHGFKNDKLNDFRRLDKATVDTLIFNEANFTQHVWDGVIYTNGCLSSRSAKPSGGWDMIEVYPKGAAHVSAFAFERSGANTGGQRLAEVILYERELTEREKVATRNYLMKKWFGAEMQELPEETGNSVDGIGELTVDGTVVLNTGSSYVEELVGTGTVSKVGAGTLTLERFDSFTGTVEVAAGVLALSGSTQDVVTAAMATDGLVLHMDAGYGITTGADERGRVTVEEWRSKVGGIKAVPDAAGMSPIYSPQGLNGLPTVDMKDRTYNMWQILRFVDADGELTDVGNIRSVFWVIGSQDGGGYLLGGGTNTANTAARYNFHRGGSTAGRVADEPLLSGAAQYEVQAANWRVNGRKIRATATGLSGRWDIVSMALQPTAVNATRAEGFAFDGRFRPHAGDYSYGDRSSGQRLAEVLFYDRVLSEEEIAATEAYLSRKWNVNVPVASEENDLTVLLSDGSTLETGELPHLAGLGGAGTVTGDVAPGRLVVDFAVEGFIDVAGTFTIAPGMEIEVRNVAEAPADSTWVRILDADEFAGIGNLADCTVTGETLPKGKKLSVRVREGGIYVKCGDIGSAIVIR